MSTTKVGVASPDQVLKRADYSESALARIAHVNEAIRLLKKNVSDVGELPASTNLSATTVNGLRVEVEARLDAIETKLNSIIKSLS